MTQLSYDYNTFPLRERYKPVTNTFQI